MSDPTSWTGQKTRDLVASDLETWVGREGKDPLGSIAFKKMESGSN